MICLYCCSDRGEALGEKIKTVLECDEEVRVYTVSETKKGGGLKTCVADDFKKASTLIFIGATGIAVRVIAPLVESKFTDPAVLVVDDQGRFVISLLSGHIGGGNALTLKVSEGIGATPVVTTASDGMSLSSIDLVLKDAAVPVQKYRDLALHLASRMLKGDRIALYTEEPQRLGGHSLEGIRLVSQWEDLFTAKEEIRLYIGNCHSRNVEIEKLPQAFAVIPQNLILGTGSRKGLAEDVYIKAYEDYMRSLDLSPSAVKTLASVDIKAEESCMRTLANRYGMTTHFFTKEELARVQDAFPKSDQVQKVLGINAVAGPSAYLLSQGHLIGEVWKGSGCTFAVGRELTW